MELIMQDFHDINGRPILSLDDKLKALKACILAKASEDALGHLFDLFHVIAPGWEFKKYTNMDDMIAYYGEPVLPIRCPFHPKYTAARRPKTDCRHCLLFYKVRTELNDEELEEINAKANSNTNKRPASSKKSVGKTPKSRRR